MGPSQGPIRQDQTGPPRRRLDVEPLRKMVAAYEGWNRRQMVSFEYFLYSGSTFQNNLAAFNGKRTQLAVHSIYGRMKQTMLAARIAGASLSTY